MKGVTVEVPNYIAEDIKTLQEAVRVFMADTKRNQTMAGKSLAMPQGEVSLLLNGHKRSFTDKQIAAIGTVLNKDAAAAARRVHIHSDAEKKRRSYAVLRTHTPERDVIRHAIQESETIDITCLLDPEWRTVFCQDVRDFVKKGKGRSMQVNLPAPLEPTLAEMRERFEENETLWRGDLDVLRTFWNDLATEFPTVVTVRDLVRLPSYTCVRCHKREGKESWGYIRLHGHKMNRSTYLPAFEMFQGDTLWDFCEREYGHLRVAE